MLRCTEVGLITLMMSEKYAGKRDELFNEKADNFQTIIKNESYYILRFMPSEIAKKLGEAHMVEILGKQKKNGLWKVKNAERITYDIYAALKNMSLLQDLFDNGQIKHDTLSLIQDKYDYYSLLIKKNIFNSLTEADQTAISDIIGEIKSAQSDDGSWDSTVVGTTIAVEKLTDLGLDANDSAVKRGCDFLFSQLNTPQPAHHIGSPYGFEAEYMFSSSNRQAELQLAEKLKPEWIPRQVCFHHLGVIQHCFAMLILMRLGYEKNELIQSALDNLYSIYKEFGGFCDSNIKKKYIADNGIKL